MGGAGWEKGRRAAAARYEAGEELDVGGDCGGGEEGHGFQGAAMAGERGEDAGVGRRGGVGD